MLRCEAAQELGDVLIRVLSATSKRLLLRRSHLRTSMLTDCLVRWPMPFLAFMRLK